MCAYVYLHLHLFGIPLIYWNAHFKYIKKALPYLLEVQRYGSKQDHALKALSHGAIFLATFNAILLLSKGGSSRYSDRGISRKCDVTMGTVGATERRMREPLGGSGGMLTQKNFEI